jgi:hypothetical protein
MGQTCDQCRAKIAAAGKARRGIKPLFLFQGIVAKHKDGSADWGSSEDDGTLEGPYRNGGVRGLTRPVDTAEREEREVYGRSRFAWRTVTGPVPKVSHGDHHVAMAYLFWLEYARDMGGWSTNEMAGLYREIRKWRIRANGQDPKWNHHGNNPGIRGEASTVEVIKADRHPLDDLLKDFGNGEETKHR